MSPKGAVAAAPVAVAAAPAVIKVARGTTAVVVEPKIPKAWANVVSHGESNSCEVYTAELVDSVRHRLCSSLQKLPAVGGMVGKLEQQEPLQISDAGGVGKLQSFKEHWRWENCKKSLGNNGVYEAPGSLFWLSTSVPTWMGQQLPAANLTYGQVAAGRQMWSEDKFIRSADDPDKRQYFTQGLISSAIVSMQDVPDEEKRGFSMLPCLCSRAVLIGWYSAMDDALRADATAKVIKLYEAALSMPMRLRVAPSRDQIILDSISYSEELYATKSASSDSFFDWVEKVVGVFPKEPTFVSLTGKAVKDRGDKLGITFHGNKVNENIQRALQHAAPFVLNHDVRVAFKAFEDVSDALNDQTKLSYLMNTASKHYMKGSEAAVGAVVQVLQSLRLALVYKDIKKDAHLTKEFLVGGRNKAQLQISSFKISRFAFANAIEIISNSVQVPRKCSPES